MKQQTSTALQLKLSDQVIGHLRELLQLAMISGTNFVDHCRAIRMIHEPSSDTMVLSSEYIEGWNKMAEEYHAAAQKKAEKMSVGMVEDDDDDDKKAAN